MRILIPVDGSEPSQKTVQWAVTTLEKATTSVLLLTVISDSMLAEYRIEDAAATLEQARSALEANGIPVEKAQYVMGDPVERICRFAEEERVDQILMGSHGRGGLAKMLLGSVSQGVLEKSRIPVLIFRETVHAFG